MFFFVFFFFLDELAAREIPLCDNADHPLTVKDADYLRAVHAAIDASRSDAPDRRRENDTDFYLTNTLTAGDVQDYWEQYLRAFPERRTKTWDVFEKAVNKYYRTLHRT